MVSKEDISAFLKSEFPQNTSVVHAVGNRSATLMQPVGLAQLRPGGTVSGPVMMGLADVAVYVAILGEIGIVPLTVTTSLSINFLRKPAAERNVVAVCKLLKLGKTLAVGDVFIYSEGSPEVVAHAVATYAIPPKR